MRASAWLGVVLLASALADSSYALDEAPRVVTGRVARIDGPTVEIGGQRGLLEAGSDVRSDGRAVSPASIRVGMQATMEMDSRGHILEIRVGGLVE